MAEDKCKSKSNHVAEHVFPEGEFNACECGHFAHKTPTPTLAPDPAAKPVDEGEPVDALDAEEAAEESEHEEEKSHSHHHAKGKAAGKHK